MPGLHKLWNPAILDGRTWSKLGDHGEQRDRGEHGKDGKHQSDDTLLFIRDTNTLFVIDFFCQSDDSIHFILRFLCLTYALG